MILYANWCNEAFKLRPHPYVWNSYSGIILHILYTLLFLCLCFYFSSPIRLVFRLESLMLSPALETMLLRLENSCANILLWERSLSLDPLMWERLQPLHLYTLWPRTAQKGSLFVDNVSQCSNVNNHNLFYKSLQLYCNL